MPFFIHIGDCHMAANARNADRWLSIDTIIAENKNLPGLAAWLIPGDLNHARMTIDDRNGWSSRLIEMAMRAPVVITRGNHDLEGDLDVFAKLRAEWPIYVIDRPETLRIRLACGGFASIFVLPYPTQAGLASAGVGPSEMLSTAYEALDRIFMAAAAELTDARARGDITMMIGHVNVRGSITSVGQPNVGHEIEIDEALLARLGPIYKGLNHIHVGQEIYGAHYAGSICRLSWGEIEPKRYLVIEYRDDGTALVDERPIDVAAMWHVEGDLTRNSFTWRVTKGPDGEPLDPPMSWVGLEVRVRARFNQSEKALIEMAKAQILANFAEAKRFELELIAVPDRALRAPAVAAAKSIEDKVGAWATVTNTTVPGRVARLLPALEHGDPDAVVIDTQLRVEQLVAPAAEEKEVAVA